VSSEELEEYKRIITKREKGEPSPPLSPSRDDTFGGDTTDPGEHTYNEETDGNRTFSEGEGEGDTSRATDPDSALSPKKEKKKKGLRTPSFLKKKKKDKKKEKTPA
jgi:adducin